MAGSRIDGGLVLVRKGVKHDPAKNTGQAYTKGRKVFSGSNRICDLPSPPGRKRLGYRAAPDKSDF
jgi:hypothetical protein